MQLDIKIFLNRDYMDLIVCEVCIVSLVASSSPSLGPCL